jgi:Ca2+-binding RTX toxin-like protein
VTVGTLRRSVEVYGEAGRDTLVGGPGNDRLDGGAGHDVLRGGDGNDVLLGGGGNDRLIGGNGFDQLVGGAGFRDVLLGGNGHDTLGDADGVARAWGENGGDTLDLYFAPDWNLKGRPVLPAGAISGGNGGDVLRVTSDNSALRLVASGDHGDDRIESYGTWGRLRVFGGDGTDTLQNRGVGLLELDGIELEE